MRAANAQMSLHTEYHHKLCCLNWKKKKRCRWRFRPNFVPSKAVVLLLLIHSLMYPLVCRGSVFGHRFAMHHLVFFLVLQSSRRGKESMVPYFTIFLLLVFCGCSSRCHGLIWSMQLWYFLIILAYASLGQFIRVWYLSQRIRRDRTFAQSRQSLWKSR